MNSTLFSGIYKSLKFLLITLVSSLNLINYSENEINNYNIDFMKTTYEYKKTDNFNTIEIETFQMDYGDKKVIKKGQNGIYYHDNNDIVTIKNKIDEIIEVGIKNKGIYKGIMTAYGPDCIGCSSVGNVYCANRYGKAHSLVNDGIYYNDIDYKNLRILAADHREFPCGTIIEFNNSNFSTPVLGIVMDTGYSMRKAYDNNKVHIDLAFASENNINEFYSTDANTNFKVKRWGW